MATISNETTHMELERKINEANTEAPFAHASGVYEEGENSGDKDDSEHYPRVTKNQPKTNRMTEAFMTEQATADEESTAHLFINCRQGALMSYVLIMLENLASKTKCGTTGTLLADALWSERSSSLQIEIHLLKVLLDSRIRDYL
nr:uncharacterized protein LOC109192285 [Ipomoea batatas]